MAIRGFSGWAGAPRRGPTEDVDVYDRITESLPLRFSLPCGCPRVRPDVRHPRAAVARGGGAAHHRAESAGGGRPHPGRGRGGGPGGGPIATEPCRELRVRRLPSLRIAPPRLLRQSGTDRALRPGARNRGAPWAPQGSGRYRSRCRQADSAGLPDIKGPDGNGVHDIVGRVLASVPVCFRRTAAIRSSARKPSPKRLQNGGGFQGSLVPSTAAQARVSRKRLEVMSALSQDQRGLLISFSDSSGSSTARNPAATRAIIPGLVERSPRGNSMIYIGTTAQLPQRVTFRASNRFPARGRRAARRRHARCTR